MVTLVKTNKYSDNYTIEPIWEEFQIDKKANEFYWKSIEDLTDNFIVNLAQDGGIHINEFGGSEFVQVISSLVIKKLEERFPEAKFPVID